MIVEEEAAESAPVEFDETEVEEVAGEDVDEVEWEVVADLELVVDAINPVAAVIVVETAYVFTAPDVLTRVKSPPFTELPESAESERAMWQSDGYLDM